MIFPSSFAHETQLVVRPLVVYMNFVGLFDFGTGGILAVAVVDTADMVLLLLPLQVLEKNPRPIRSVVGSTCTDQGTASDKV